MIQKILGQLFSVNLTLWINIKTCLKKNFFLDEIKYNYRKNLSENKYVNKKLILKMMIIRDERLLRERDKLLIVPKTLLGWNFNVVVGLAPRPTRTRR